MASITLDSLRKAFGETTAVDGIDLDIADGEFLVLVGPSGCGKSTLLRTIAGLETPTGGDLHIGSERVNDTEPKDRGVAMVFQNYALYPHMSARRNMTFGLGSHRSVTDDELDEMIADISEMLGIEALLDRRPSALSGGEKQRVAMGRALIREPEVFLLDEPLSNLDAKLRDEMRAELTHLHERIQTTTVYVTHDQTEAMTLGDRVAVMNDGRIEHVGRPQEVYDRPNSRFVAEFIGSPRINVLDVDTEERPDGLSLVGDEFTISLQGQSVGTALDGREVELGVRPEDLELAAAADSDGVSEPMEMEVTLRETLGNSVVVHGRLGDEQIRVQADSRCSVAPGDRIDVVADCSRLHLFDTDSGETVYRTEQSVSESAALGVSATDD